MKGFEKVTVKVTVKVIVKVTVKWLLAGDVWRQRKQL